MRQNRTVRGFSAGVLVGVLAGSAGMAVAAFGYNGWQRFSEDFKGGYVAGFIDMANLARNLEPGGYVDKRYPYLPMVKSVEWRSTVDSLYAKPENHKFTISSVLQLASHELEKKYGKAPDPGQRARDRMVIQLGELKKMQDARAAAGTPGAAPAPGAAKPDPALGGNTGQSSSPPRKLATNEKRQKKWCRCDGKDPKAERAKRRAQAEKEEAEAAKKPDTGKSATPAAAGTEKPATAAPAQAEKK